MADNTHEGARVAMIMGSSSDWGTMKEACRMLDRFAIVYTKEVISSHRAPEHMAELAHQA